MSQSRRSSKVIAWIKIMRPLIVFISCFGASVGALNVTVAKIAANQGFTFITGSYLWLLLGAALLSSGLMVHNDYTDYDSDCVNRPNKPLPKGIIGKTTANIAGLLLMIATIVVAGLTTYFTSYGWNWTCFMLTLLIVAIGFAYNRYGKHWGIWGHAMVAFGVGAIPVWGAIAVRPQRPLMMLPLGLAIFVMEIGREIMVCAGDMRGDRAAGFSTTPLRIGRLRSMWLAAGFYTAALPLFPISYFGWFGFPKLFGHLYLIGACVFMLLLYVTWLVTYRAAKTKNEADIWRAFELYIRLGTRLDVVAFQLVLFLEAFF